MPQTGRLGVRDLEMSGYPHRQAAKLLDAQNRDQAAFGLDEAPLTKAAQHAGDRLAGSGHHLGELLLRCGDCDEDATVGLLSVGGCYSSGLRPSVVST